MTHDVDNSDCKEAASAELVECQPQETSSEESSEADQTQRSISTAAAVG